MKQYLLNAEASLALYKDNASKINPKDCYINIFNVLTTYPRRFGTGEWKIAYGYVSSIENVFCRHCFIFAEEKVIDPTIFSTERDNSERIYYLTKIFDSVDEYLSALDAEEGYPALTKYLQEKDKAASEWAVQNGYLFIG